MRLVFKSLFSILLICCLFPISAIAVQASELNETNTVGSTLVSIVLCKVSVAADKDVEAAGYTVTVNGKPYTGDLTALPAGSEVEIRMSSLPKGKRLKVTASGVSIKTLSDDSVVFTVTPEDCLISLSFESSNSGNSSDVEINGVNNNVSGTDKNDGKKSDGKQNKVKNNKSKPSLKTYSNVNGNSNLPYSQHPNTGKNGGIPYWAIIMLFTSAGIIADSYLRRKRRKG